MVQLGLCIKICVLLTLLNGCVEGQLGGRNSTNANSGLNQRNAVSRDANCYESNKIKVMQIFDKGILAHLCPIEYRKFYQDEFDACRAEGELVFLPVKPNENDYVDDQKVTLPQNQCFAPDGTFSYTRSDDVQKRVRKIKIINK
ncbi:MAG: hypothetical protein KF713_00020 [Turneriella sp.]|nr:hypothetical protein [Turneriella sp.]